VNVKERTVFAVSMPQFSNFKASIMLTDFSIEGVLGAIAVLFIDFRLHSIDNHKINYLFNNKKIVLFQEHTSQILVLDFIANLTITIKLPLKGFLKLWPVNNNQYSSKFFFLIMLFSF
jgi:hypothetical protein